MIARLLIIITAIVLIYLLLRWFRRTAPEKVASLLRRIALGAAIVGVILLAVTGRLHWLFALFAALIPLVRRIIPLIRYIPLLRTLYARYRERQNGANTQGGQRTSSPPEGEMKLKEAYEILGLKPGATREEIKAAHRALMQKNHPDRGGSAWMAKQLNAARDRLLSEFK